MPVEPPAEMIERLRGELSEPPAARVVRLGKELDLERALVLVTGGLDDLYSATVVAGADPMAASNVIANNVVGAGVDPSTVDAVELAKLVSARERIPRAAFDEAIGKSGDPGFSAEPFLAREVVSDASELDPVIDSIIAANPGQVAAFRGGKEGLLGFFVGQVMKETGGQADPRAVSEIVRGKLLG